MKVPDVFALRLREGRLPAQVASWSREPVALVRLERAYGAKRTPDAREFACIGRGFPMYRPPAGRP